MTFKSDTNVIAMVAIYFLSIWGSNCWEHPQDLSQKILDPVYTPPPLRKALLGIRGKITCNGISRFIEYILIVVIPESEWEAVI
jgi:hypothetical protein